MNTPQFGALEAEAASRYQRAFDAQMSQVNARAKLAPAGCDQQGREATRHLPDACAEEGSQHADPVPTGSMTKKTGALVGLLMVALPWLLVIVCWAIVVRWAN